MEFLVEFEVNVPAGAPTDEVEDRDTAEGSAGARLAEEGHLIRLWKLPATGGQSKAVGLYRACSTAQLDSLLDALPLADWMHVAVTQLAPHPNDPVGAEATARAWPQQSRRGCPAGCSGAATTTSRTGASHDRSAS